jgi:uncharacterized membrane protein SirB2
VLAAHFALLRGVHVAAVVVSVTLLILRSWIGIRSTPDRVPRALRLLPHFVDTVLLASAVCLTLAIGQYPFLAGWLTAKVVALVAYVVVGSIAVKRGRSPNSRAAALGASLLVVAYIVATAVHHDPAPWHW